MKMTLVVKKINCYKRSLLIKATNLFIIIVNGTYGSYETRH
jgi:hypothetical protein